MTWWAVVARPAEGSSPGLASWLVQQSGQAVEEREDGTLVAYATDEPSARAILRRLEGELGVDGHTEAVESVDWAVRWRDGIGARRFGRLLLVPSWLADSITEPGPRVVLDPESAFGSGEHGSTRGALTLLERLLQPGQAVLDLGSGSGILAIAAVVLGARRAIGIEIDAEANAVAERNAAQNTLTATQFLTGDAGLLAPLAGPADLILSNILRTVNVTLLPVIRRALAPGGTAVFAGMEEAEAGLFLPALAAAGFQIVDEVRDAGWWSVAARLT